MRGKALSFLVSFALGVLPVLPLRAAEVWRGPSSLEVRVEDSSGKAVQGAKVRLLYQAVEPKVGPAIASTDADGEAFFFSLAEGWWALEVSKEGALSIHSEFVLSGEKKPAVLSTFQENTPGATQTLQVRIGRPRAGRAAGDPTGGPQVGRPAAPAPAPAPAPAAEPSAPAAPVPAVSAPPVPEVEEAPAEEKPVPPTPPAAPAPVPAPSAPPAAAPAPTPVPSTPPPAAPETAAPAPSTAAPQEKPAPSSPPPSAPIAVQPVPRTPPNPAPVPSNPPVAVPTPVPPAPTVAPAPAAPATPVPALPAPKAQRRSYAERSCLECKAGEEAFSVEVSVPPGGAPCGDGLEDRLRERDPGKAEAGLPSSCRLLRITLPPEARFTGYRYEVEDGGASRDCRAGADCPVGTCRFPLDPGIRRGPAGTAFTAAFENTSTDRERRAIFTVYFAPE